jgi:hypothetical protein
MYITSQAGTVGFIILQDNGRTSQQRDHTRMSVCVCVCVCVCLCGYAFYDLY